MRVKFKIINVKVEGHRSNLVGQEYRVKFVEWVFYPHRLAGGATGWCVHTYIVFIFIPIPFLFSGHSTKQTKEDRL